MNKSRRSGWHLSLSRHLRIAGLLAGLLTPLAAQVAVPLTPPEAQIVDAMSAHERQLYLRLQELRPRVETYMQDLRLDPTLGAVPVADRYYLGILHFDGSFRTTSFLQQPPQTWRRVIGPLDDALTAPARRLLGLDLFRDSFVGMLFPGANHFDRQHYQFEYLRREFLGNVRCYVFNVVPLNPGARGNFWGRIWIEDQDDILVRFNGSFWQDRFLHPDLHFDSWRINTQPGVWLPADVYAEESDLGYGLFRHARYQAQTRIWGYDLSHAGRQESLTSLDVEGADVAPTAPAGSDNGPLASTRAWERQAEDNVLDRLETAGLLAPEGPADKVLQTVVNNIVYANHLAITPPVRCRILLTTPLEAFDVGHTIVLSRGLIDSLPDETSLAAMLAHELAQINLGQHLDTQYAFADRMLFADQDSLRLLNVKRTAIEEGADNVEAVRLLKGSLYAGQLASAGLFLRQVAARQKLSPHLFDPNLGNGWFSHDYLTRLAALETAAPRLVAASVTQIAALPLGGRLVVNPWDGSLSLQNPESIPLLSAREKMPLQLSPFDLYLQRVAPRASSSSDPGKAGGH